MLVGIVLTAFSAGNPIVPQPAKVKFYSGEIQPISGGATGIYNGTFADSLKLNDTAFIVFPMFYPNKNNVTANTLTIPYSNQTKPLIEILVKKGSSVAADTTINIAYYESLYGYVTLNTGTYTYPANVFPNTPNGATITNPIGYLDWFPVQGGTLGSTTASTDTIKCVANRVKEIDFYRQNIFFESRFLAIRLINASKTKGVYKFQILVRNNAF